MTSRKWPSRRGGFLRSGNGPGQNVQGGNCPDPRQTDGLHKETARTHRGIKRSGILSTGVRVAFFMITVTSHAVIFIYYKLRACNLTRRRPLGARRWSSWLAILGNPLNPLRAYRPTLRSGGTMTMGDESVPIQLAQCRFPGLAITNAKI